MRRRIACYPARLTGYPLPPFSRERVFSRRVSSTVDRSVDAIRSGQSAFPDQSYSPLPTAARSSPITVAPDRFGMLNSIAKLDFGTMPGGGAPRSEDKRRACRQTAEFAAGEYSIAIDPRGIDRAGRSTWTRKESRKYDSLRRIIRGRRVARADSAIPETLRSTRSHPNGNACSRLPLSSNDK